LDISSVKLETTNTWTSSAIVGSVFSPFVVEGKGPCTGGDGGDGGDGADGGDGGDGGDGCMCTGGEGSGSTCSSDCELEFKTCVNEGPGYDQCVSELRAGTGRLGDVCVSNCKTTCRMCHAPSPPPPRASGVCSLACEKEFDVCAEEGPGYTTCVSEVNSATGRLGAVCQAGCTLTDEMKTHDHSKCRKACDVEFNLCVVHGPGFAACKSEFESRPSASPLTSACDSGCAMSDTMLAQNDASKSTCPEACINEFKFCMSEGPGLVECVYEIRAQIEPLKSVCPRDCRITDEMETYVAPSPPPFPPSHTCSESCESEFRVCAMHAEGATAVAKCSACRSEINSQPAGSPLVEKGCSINCVYTDAMKELCP